LPGICGTGFSRFGFDKQSFVKHPQGNDNKSNTDNQINQVAVVFDITGIIKAQPPVPKSPATTPAKSPITK